MTAKTTKAQAVLNWNFYLIFRHEIHNNTMKKTILMACVDTDIDQHISN